MRRAAPSDSDAGLMASSVMSHLAEDQFGVSEVEGEAREKLRWLHAVARRRAAIAQLCDEQRAAFVAAWLRRSTGAAAPSVAPIRGST